MRMRARERRSAMKISATLKFWAGCIFIILSATFPVFFPVFPALSGTVIILAVLFCIRQWYRNARELKNLLGQEQRMRLAADKYINARIPTGTSQRKKR